MLETDLLQPKLSVIPGYMPISLDVAKGFKFGPRLEFQQLSKVLQNGVQGFHKIPITLCHGNVDNARSQIALICLDFCHNLVIIVTKSKNDRDLKITFSCFE